MDHIKRGAANDCSYTVVHWPTNNQTQ